GTGGRAGLLPLTAGAAVPRQQLDDLLAHAGQIRAELHEHLRGDAFTFANETEEDVFRPDVVVTELQRLAQLQLQHFLGARREGNVAARGRAALTDDLLDLTPDRFERDAE